MNTTNNFEAELAAKGDLARLKAELEAAVRELDEHRSATLFMLEDLEENRKRIERSRQEWVRVFDGVLDPIFVHDREFRIVRCNRAYAERAGMPIQEVIGKPYFEVFPKRDGPLPGCYTLAKGEQAEAEAEAEEELRLDDGEILLSRSFIVYDAAGAFQFAVHIMDDITERKRTEEAIVKAGEEFHMLFDAIADAIFIADTEGHFLQVNHSACERLGYSQQELQRMAAADIDTPEYAAKIPERLRALQDRGQLVFESAHVRKDGGVIPVELNVRLVNHAGKPALLTVARDITRRKEQGARIEHLNRLIRSARDINRLLTSEKDRERLLQSSCDVLVREAGYRMVWIGATEQGHKRVVPAAQAGFTAGYLDSVAITWDEAPSGQGPTGTAMRTGERSMVQDLESDPRYAPWREAALKRGYRSSATFPLIAAHNSYGVLHLYAGKPNAFDTEEIALLTEVADDIAFALRGIEVESKRKRAEERLREIAAELSEAQRVARLGNWDLDTETGNVIWSEELYRIFGRDPALPAPGYEEHPRILAPESYARMNAAIEKTRQTGEPYQLDLELVRPDGRRKWIAARGEAKRDINGQIVGLRGTALDITERKEAEKRRQHDAETLRRGLEDTIRAVALTIEMRDPYTAGHQRRVADLTAAIAKELGLPEDQIHGLHLAGIIHDLGKVRIPAEILSNPGKLTDIEFSLIKAHPRAGYDILKDVEFPWPIAQIVLQHHERLDGSGYPQKLKAEQILLEAKILAVADVVEAMASHRPYRASLGIDKALAEIEQGRGRAYDPATVDACVKLFREQGFTFAN